MIPSIKRWLVVSFLVLTVALLAWFKLTQPRILVIQSYDSGYAWSRDIDIGLRRVFDGNLHFKVQWHYMNTKKHPDEDFKRRAGMLAKHEIETFHPDLVIAIDDDAQKYVVKEYAGDPNMKIVFAGINGATVEPYGYDKAPNATGIYERKPLKNLRDALLVMRDRNGNPLGRRIVHIGDRSASVLEDSKEIESMNWSPFTLVDSRKVATMEDWKKAVAEAQAKADLIVISNYQNILPSDVHAGFVPPEEVMKWTEANSQIPVVGMGAFMVEDGGMFAIGASGFEQGDVIARMVNAILEKKKIPKEISEVIPRQYLVYMRHSIMDKRGVTLPDIYEAFSRASNNYHE